MNKEKLIEYYNNEIQTYKERMEQLKLNCKGKCN